MIKKTVDRWRLFILISHSLAIVIFAATNSWAQGFNIYNATDISQPWLSEFNPAVISSQFSRVSVGLKVFHFGFLQNQSFEIRESRINGSFPFYLPMDLGAGCDLRYFSAGIYSEFTGSLMFSRRIQNNLSLGIKIGIGRYGFDRQDFNLVDMNDPLLSGSLGKTFFNFGFGAFWNPERWSVGIGIDHLNRPDIGRGTVATLPQEISASIGYKFGWITPNLLLHHDGNFARFGLAVSASHERFGLFRLAFESSMPIKMEFLFNLSRDNSLQYGFDLPTEELSSVSMGSHEIVYSRILDRGPDIGQPRMLISTNEMQIQEETIIRSMPAGLNQWQLENIKELVPEYLKTDADNRNLLVVPTGALNQYETEKIRQNRYARLCDEIKSKLQEHPELEVILQTNDQSLADARSLKQYLTRNGIKDVGIAKVNAAEKVKLEGFEAGQQLKTQKKPSCSVDKLSIKFELTGKVHKVREWILAIKNSKGETIRTYKGKDRLPELMSWDWKNEWGELVPAGQYSGTLVVKSMSGQRRSAETLPINVTRLNRTVYLKFTQESKLQASRITP